MDSQSQQNMITANATRIARLAARDHLSIHDATARVNAIAEQIFGRVDADTVRRAFGIDPRIRLEAEDKGIGFSKLPPAIRGAIINSQTGGMFDAEGTPLGYMQQLVRRSEAGETIPRGALRKLVAQFGDDLRYEESADGRAQLALVTGDATTKFDAIRVSDAGQAYLAQMLHGTPNQALANAAPPVAQTKPAATVAYPLEYAPEALALSNALAITPSKRGNSATHAPAHMPYTAAQLREIGKVMAVALREHDDAAVDAILRFADAPEEPSQALPDEKQMTKFLNKLYQSNMTAEGREQIEQLRRKLVFSTESIPQDDTSVHRDIAGLPHKSIGSHHVG